MRATRVSLMMKLFDRYWYYYFQIINKCVYDWIIILFILICIINSYVYDLPSRWKIMHSFPERLRKNRFEWEFWIKLIFRLIGGVIKALKGQPITPVAMTTWIKQPRFSHTCPEKHVSEGCYKSYNIIWKFCNQNL